MTKIKLCSLLIVFLTTSNAYAEEYSLSVHVKGIKNNQGNIYVELYNDAKAFRKSALALSIKKIAAQSGTIDLKFDGLATGHYAILAYHDEDGNGSLNKRFGMIPTEGYALSNDPSVIGPPSFEECEFEVLGDNEISTNMHY